MKKILGIYMLMKALGSVPRTKTKIKYKAKQNKTNMLFWFMHTLIKLGQLVYLSL